MPYASILLGLAAAASSQPAPSGTPGEVLTKEQAEARLANCGKRKFAAVAEFPVDGKMRRSRLELCAADSESDAEWIAKLEKAEASVQAQTRLPEAARFKVLTALRAEIDRLKGASNVVAIRNDSLTVATDPAPAVPKSDFAVSALPPLPVPKKVSTVAAAQGGEPDPDTLGRKPRLTVRCLQPGASSARCSYLASDTLLEVRAEEATGSSTAILFRGTNTPRESLVKLGRMRAGQTRLVKVPESFCRGLLRAHFYVALAWQGSAKDDVLGRYEKRC